MTSPGRLDSIAAFLAPLGLGAHAARLAASERLTADSRQVRPGAVFAAVKGLHRDGHDFVDEVAKAGAAALVVDATFRPGVDEVDGAPLLRVFDVADFLRGFASPFYGHPSRDLRVLGVTGTNGKTTSTYLLEAIENSAGRPCGVIGTIEARFGDRVWPAANTTPDAVDLQFLLYEMRKAGAKSVAIEVSSHALQMDRVRGLELDVLVFTNFTRDHLDFHGSMDAYLEAKLKGFDLLHASPKKNKRAVIWDRIAEREKVLGRLDGRDFQVLRFDNVPGINEVLRFDAIEMTPAGSVGILLQHGKSLAEAKIPLIGKFNVRNALGALGAVCSLEGREAMAACLKTCVAAIQDVRVPGRMERIDVPNGSWVFVDYAHTPDALENVLKTFGQIPHGRLLCLFGCGGDRDATKRPIMGRIAAELSDYAILTSDNPRTEDPRRILAQVEAGIMEGKGEYAVIEDRTEAIRFAVSLLRKGDILLVAGKGHEDYQILGERKIHFDDREKVREALAL